MNVTSPITSPYLHPCLPNAYPPGTFSTSLIPPNPIEFVRNRSQSRDEDEIYYMNREHVWRN